MNKVLQNLILPNERVDVVDKKLRLIQKDEGFSYGTDAVLLAAFIRKMGAKKAVEFGAGTGIISLLCEEFSKFKNIYSIEVQDEYFDLLSRNVQLNDSKIVPLKKDIRELKPTDTDGEVDVVFSNPAYMRVDSGFLNGDDGKKAARHEVCGSIDDFVFSASKILKHGGLFYCVYRPDRLIDLIDSMRRHKLEPKRMTSVYSYYDSRSCLVLIEAKKGAAPSLFTTKPFIIFNCKTSDNSDISADMKKVYEECDMDDEYKIL